MILGVDEHKYDARILVKRLSDRLAIRNRFRVRIADVRTFRNLASKHQRVHPVLRALGIPTKDAGLATAMVEASAPISVVQSQMRHADVATTLRIYTHVPFSNRSGT
jgi:site-specific recombinase XerC